MRLELAGVVAAAVIASSMIATPTLALPLAGASSSGAGVEQVAYRRCWLRKGNLVCRWLRTHPEYDRELARAAASAVPTP